MGTWESWIFYWVVLTYSHVVHYTTYKEPVEGWMHFVTLFLALLLTMFVEWLVSL